eukprot:TRINITY_DN7371_c0_g1_i1.p2 TRINITY_DN7371_c0_g1~~TRINITY_DN7371_c0_g1_i1.p2  ORF type:complete len:173 (+),score=4.37 TRINITY_DN7371_c0_g1_i1:1052-1570(+)
MLSWVSSCTKMTRMSWTLKCRDGVTRLQVGPLLDSAASNRPCIMRVFWINLDWEPNVNRPIIPCLKFCCLHAGANNADCVDQHVRHGRASYWTMPQLDECRLTIVYRPTQMACVAEYANQTVYHTDNETMPTPNGLLVHMNLWLYQGQTYNLTQPVDVTITDFVFEPFGEFR